MLRSTIGALVLVMTGTAASAQTEPPLRILITNDDGVSSAGIAALVTALHPIADVVVAAPAEDNSGQSQSITLFARPLKVDSLPASGGVPHYAVHGTPADSVVFGLLETGKERPFDMVISGINKGENVGDAVPVSGTIGAARQAVMMGVPAIAVSQQYRRDGGYDFRLAARYTAQLVQQLHRMGKAAPRLVNVNVPTEAKGVRFVPAAGSSFAITTLRKMGEEGGSASYRVDFKPGAAGTPGADTAALAAGYITVSALIPYANDTAATRSLEKVKAIRALPAR